MTKMSKPDLICPLCSHFAQLATSIVATADSDDDDAVELKNHFPDFLWLVRDVILIPFGEDGKEVPPTEYLMTKVLRRSKSFNETKSDKVARAILTIFPTIECRMIWPPSSDPWMMRNVAAKQDSLEPQFNRQVQELAEYLLQRVRGKKGVLSGKMADGPILAAMATDYLEAVNKPGAIPCISDTWQAAVETRCKKVMEQLLQEYDDEIRAKVTEIGLPMEDSPDDSDPANPHTLLALHRFILLEKSKALLKQMGHFVPRSATAGVGVSMESLSAELESGAATFTEESTEHEIEGQQVTRKKVTGGILFKYAQENYEASRSRCIELFEELYAAIKEKMKQAQYSFDELMEDLEQLQDKYDREAVGPAKWEVYKEKRAFIKTEEESYKNLQGFKQATFEAQREAADASAAAAKLQTCLQSLQARHEEEMKRFQKEERQRCNDFIKAQMEELSKSNGAGDASQAVIQARRKQVTKQLDQCECVCMCV